MVAKVRQRHPEVPIVLYANGSGGLLERMATTGVDAIGLDWTVDMAEGLARLPGLQPQRQRLQSRVQQVWLAHICPTSSGMS